jgi:tetratricopeptide (TPR) repeat protein
VAGVSAQDLDGVKAPRPTLVLLLLLSAAFTLGTWLQPHASNWTGHAPSDSVLKLLLGDSRRMFANHFYRKADVYFHSGRYPSIFDQAREAEEKENHMAAEQQGGHGEAEPEEATGGTGQPTDWIERFGRHFAVTEHTHLQGAETREMLPWLAISAELDPHHIETYTVASYFLRREMGKADEAERFLRQGLHANPDSYEILFELGRLYYENRHDLARARNIWTIALQRWVQKEGTQKEPNWMAYDAIAVELAHLEEEAGNYAEAIKWFEVTKRHSPHPDDIQKQIDALRAKLARQSGQG